MNYSGIIKIVQGIQEKMSDSFEEAFDIMSIMSQQTATCACTCTTTSFCLDVLTTARGAETTPI